MIPDNIYFDCIIFNKNNKILLSLVLKKIKLLQKIGQDLLMGITFDQCKSHNLTSSDAPKKNQVNTSGQALKSIQKWINLRKEINGYGTHTQIVQLSKDTDKCKILHK